MFDGTSQLVPTGPTTVEEFLRNLANYESISVRYVVVPTSQPLPSNPETRSFRMVFHDPVAEILELPRPTPFFHIAGSGCSVSSRSDDHATVSCPRAATLVREELYMPGWTATVGGRPVSVGEYDQLVEAVRLPRGTSAVAFTYRPPHVVAAGLLFGVGVVLLLGGPLFRSRRRNSGDRRGSDGSRSGP